MQTQSNRQLWAQAVKTGIIKSNLIPMIAALMLALYTYELDFIDCGFNFYQNNFLYL